MNIYRPSMKDIPLITRVHRQYYGKSPKYNYYEGLLYPSHNPFYVATDDKNHILGFISARVEPEKSEIYITSYVPLYLEDDDPALFDELEQGLIGAVEKNALKLKVKKISMHSRKKKINTSRAFDMAGFTIEDAGTYKDGEKKLHIFKDFKGGLDKISVPSYKTKQKTHKPKPKPKPKKGVYTIRPATTADSWRVVKLHNEHMGKQREGSYFSNLITRFKRPVYFVATDSNGDVIGYAAARPVRPPIVKSGKHTRLNFVSMAIDPKWRGLGIGQDLIMSMIDEVKSRPEMEHIYGHVRGKNKGARRLYAKMGFKETNIGNYKDDDDIKYLIKKRFRLPSIKPYWNEYKDYFMWFAIGIGTHEAIHIVRDYED